MAVRGYLLRRVGDSVDLEEDVGVEEGSHLHRRARWWIGGIDELVPDSADSRQVLDICQEHLKLHDMGEGQANGLQPVPHILEGLPRLRREVADADDLIVQVERYLTRDVDRSPAGDLHYLGVSVGPRHCLRTEKACLYLRLTHRHLLPSSRVLLVAP